MSITCSKEYTLTLASSMPAPFAYFKCEEANGAVVMTDEISGNNLDADTLVTFTSVSGKILNGMNLSGVDGITFFAPTSATWDLSASSFTIRAWIKCQYDPNLQITFLTNDAGPNPIRWQIQVYSISELVGGVEGKVYLPTSKTVWDDEIDISAGAWHRVILWWEKGVGIGLKIDNAAAKTLAATGDMAAGNSSFVVAGGGFFSGVGSAVDEIGVWKSKLTDEQMLYDWNSGNGRTYS